MITKQTKENKKMKEIFSNEKYTLAQKYYICNKLFGHSTERISDWWKMSKQNQAYVKVKANRRTIEMNEEEWNFFGYFMNTFGYKYQYKFPEHTEWQHSG